MNIYIELDIYKLEYRNGKLEVANRQKFNDYAKLYINLNPTQLAQIAGLFCTIDFLKLNAASFIENIDKSFK